MRSIAVSLHISYATKFKFLHANRRFSELGNPRTIEKLQLEKAYWEQAGVEWKLFTDREVSPSLKENLLWIKPVFAGAQWDQLSYDVHGSQVPELLKRLADFGDLKATKCCGNLDDAYGLEPGSHLQDLRYGIATRQIKAPLQKPYYDWKCSELALDDVVFAHWGLKHAN